jgi:hypothetical protein
LIRSDLAAGPTPEQDHVSQIDATLGKDAARFGLVGGCEGVAHTIAGL